MSSWTIGNQLKPDLSTNFQVYKFDIVKFFTASNLGSTIIWIGIIADICWCYTFICSPSLVRTQCKAYVFVNVCLLVSIKNPVTVLLCILTLRELKTLSTFFLNFGMDITVMVDFVFIKFAHYVFINFIQLKYLLLTNTYTSLSVKIIKIKSREANLWQ